MNAEPQGVFEIDFCYPSDFANASEIHTPTVPVAEQTKASARNLATVLENLWMFYTAMHNDKPLPNVDAKLSSLGQAMRIMVRRS